MHIKLAFTPKIILLFTSFFLLPAGINGILNGEPVDWKRHGFLVKMLASERPGGEVKSCTGTLISASLVLTSGQCVIERATKQRLREFAVFVPKPNGGLFRSTARFVERKEDGSWALLRIPPQNITKICPPSPAPRWISRLNFRPTLIDGPRIGMNPVEMADFGYGLVGFATTEQAEQFMMEKNLFRIHMNTLEKPSANDADDSLGHWTSNIIENYTACYDDAGAPLFSSMPSLQDPPIQIGLFQALTVVGAGHVVKKDEEENPLDKCRHATQMRFSLFHDDIQLAEAIQRHALAEFVTVYKECEFLGDNAE